MTNTTNMITLRSNADTNHESADDWYANFGDQFDCGCTDCVPVSHPVVGADRLRDESDDDALADEVTRDQPELCRMCVLEAVAGAREILASAESVEEALTHAVEAYAAGDLDATIARLEHASRVERTEGGDDPATRDLRQQLLVEGEEALRARRSDLLSALSKYDDGTGTLGIVVDRALAEDPDVTPEDVRVVLVEAIDDARAEREEENHG